MTEQILIDYMAHRGDGVANSNEGSVYVPYTLPGETVTVEIVPGHPDRRHLLHVDKTSPERIEPFCPHFGICGGCAIQHWRDDRYRAWKHQLVVSALRQAGLRADVTELIDAHGEGRRRMVLHARRGTHEVLQVGFSALSTHTIVPIDHCPVSAPGLEGGIAAAWAIAECLKKEGKPLDIQLTESDTGIDVDIRGSGPLSTARLSELARLSETHKLARITRHGELVLQRTPPTIRMGRAIVTLPPGSFLQATAAGEETLAERAIALCGKSKTVMDLFCGIGPFALRLAERARVIAYDSDLPSIEALRKAVATTPKLKPVIAEARDLFRRPLMPMELKDVDAVVFDPPRQGAEAQARQLAASRVPLIVAVSCNPATFVRDAAILVGGGYRLGSVTPVDQFKHTPHVELVAAFTR